MSDIAVATVITLATSSVCLPLPTDDLLQWLNINWCLQAPVDTCHSDDSIIRLSETYIIYKYKPILCRAASIQLIFSSYEIPVLSLLCDNFAANKVRFFMS